MKSTVELKNERANANAPTGYRFLIRLIDAPSEDYARMEVRSMFGDQFADRAIIYPGSARWSTSDDKKRIDFIPVPYGFTIYVPKELRLP